MSRKSPEVASMQTHQVRIALWRNHNQPSESGNDATIRLCWKTRLVNGVTLRDKPILWAV